MPSFVTAGFLISIIAAGTALAVALLLATVAGRVLRQLIRRRRQRLERQMRSLVLTAITDEEIPLRLTTARGARGRAAERVIFAYLRQVRGEAQGLLVRVLEQRRTVAKVIRQSHRRLRYQRARAADRLGLIGSPAAVRRLGQLLGSDASVDVRIVAARALGKADSAEAAASLMRSLSRADPVPEGIVASALLELGPEAVPELRGALSADNGGGRRQRAMAAEVLGLMDDMPAWKLLAENVASTDLEVRASAVRALGRLGVPQAVAPIAGCLDPSEGADLQAVAARALGQIGDPSAAPALAVCLDDPHYWVAHNAAEALAALGPAGRRELEQAVRDGRQGMPHAREALAFAALARGELPALPGAGPAAMGRAPKGQPAASGIPAGRSR